MQKYWFRIAIAIMIIIAVIVSIKTTGTQEDKITGVYALSLSEIAQNKTHGKLYINDNNYYIEKYADDEVEGKEYYEIKGKRENDKRQFIIIKLMGDNSHILVKNKDGKHEEFLLFTKVKQ